MYYYWPGVGPIGRVARLAWRPPDWPGGPLIGQEARLASGREARLARRPDWDLNQ